MQAHRRLIAAALFLVSFVVLQFVKINSCSSYMESWLGFAPVYVVETAVAVGGAYFFMPKNPDLQDPILRVITAVFLQTAVSDMHLALCPRLWGACAVSMQRVIIGTMTAYCVNATQLKMHRATVGMCTALCFTATQLN